jgi:D-amino-acid dehydrogenase
VLPRHGGVMHETFVAYNPMGSQLRLAGTLEIGPTGRPWLRKRLHALTTAARRYLHGIDRAHITAEWAGYRPCTADGMPVIGSVPSIPGLFIGTGHAMMGLMLGPVTGRILCADICGTRQEIDPELLACMRPQRLRATRAA